MCLHGFTGSWRVWELVLPRLERRFDVLAPTFPGHAGGPPLPREPTATTMVEGVERALDEAGFETAHVVGNSLGGHVALQLAARGRARSVVALAPAGGWPARDPAQRETLDFFVRMHALVRGAAPYAAFIASTPQGRRQALAAIAERTEHIPAETVVHVIQAGALCADAPAMIELAAREPWTLDAERIACPVRIVWGTEDKLLPWPLAATRYRTEWLPHADWVELEGVGHCPQLDVPLETAELIAGFA